MRRDDQVRQLRHLGRRLLGEDVERGAAEVAFTESADERVELDDAAARGVDQQCARFDARDLHRPDQAVRLARERHVQRDDVRARKQLVEGDARDADVAHVVHEHLAPECSEPPRVRPLTTLTSAAAAPAWPPSGPRWPRPGPGGGC